MSAAKLWFGAYAFHENGIAQYGWKTEFIAEDGSAPTSQRTVYTLRIEFFESSFADNEARGVLLRTALDSGEGRLRIEDEAGTSLVDEIVTVSDSDCPRDWRQYRSEITVTFQGTARPVQSATMATYTPTGGNEIQLPNLTSLKENVETERYSDERENRAQTMVTINATGFILADKTLPLEQRRAWIMERLAEIRNTHSKDGIFRFAGQEFIVRVRSLDADMGDASDRLEWSLQCFYRKFPQGDDAQSEFTVTTREDRQAGEMVTSVRGEVKAIARDSALQKVTFIRQAFQGSGQTLRVNEIGDEHLSGTDGDTWVQLSFSFEYRMSLDVLSWELRVTTRGDVRASDNTITYEGSVRGKSAGSALNQARTLGGSKHPFMLSSSEQVSTRQIDGESEQFVEIGFAYEYVAKNDWIYAEVSSQTNRDPFGDHRFVVSGFVSAATESAARSLAASLQSNSLLRREYSESKQERQSNGSGSPRHLVRLDFSATFYLTPLSVAVSYVREEVSDYESLEQSLSYNGTAYGATETACRSAINTIVESAGSGMRRRRSVRTPSFEHQTAGDHLMSVGFQEEYVGTLPASAGGGIIQASYSVRTVYSVNKSVITPIPFGVPHVQTACGVTPATRTVRGTVLAATESTALAWARGKRTLVSGGHAEPPEEDVGYEFPAFEDSAFKFVRVEFTYGARYQQLSL